MKTFFALLWGVTAGAPAPAPPTSAEGCTVRGTYRVLGDDGEPLALRHGLVYVSTRLPRFTRESARHEVFQRDRQFFPRLVVAQQHDVLHIINDDIVAHEAHADGERNHFESRLTSARDTKIVRLEDAGPSFVGCRVHDEMALDVLTIPNRLHAPLADDGSFVLTGLPNETVELTFWTMSLLDDRQTKSKMEVVPCRQVEVALSTSAGKRVIRRQGEEYPPRARP